MQPRLLKHPARLAGASLLRLQDDARLVALAREGHDPAFAAIVDRYGAQLERYCARLLGPGRAEDAVQQAFVNAHAAMRSSEQELALKPWLYRIAHNSALNILRAAKDDGLALDEDQPGASHTAEIVELREQLRETLASIQALPTPQRDALLLRELEGRSHEEIAVALGVTEGGARQHLHRARVTLRAAASAITPYPMLTRVLSAAADSGRGADLVSGAGLGVGAGAMKAAAGVLAAGAIAGGAVTVQQSHSHASRTTAQSTAVNRSTTANSAANSPSAGSLQIADDRSAGATAPHGHRHGGSGARGRGPHRRSELTHRRHDGSPDRSGSSEQKTSSQTEGPSREGSSSGDGSHDGSSGSSGSGTSGSGTSGSGSSSGGSDDTATVTTDTSGSGTSGGGSGSGDTLSSSTSGSGTSGSGSSGSDDSATTTTTTTTTSGRDGGSGTTTTDG